MWLHPSPKQLMQGNYILLYSNTYWRFTTPATADHSTSTIPSTTGDSPMRFWLWSPNLFMFIAANKSLSFNWLQLGHVHSRCDNFSSWFTYPQVHILELGSNLPIFRRFLPFHSHLYCNCLKNSFQLADDMCFARLWFFNIPFTFKSSMIIVWFSRTILDVTWCMKFLRQFVTFS